MVIEASHDIKTRASRVGQILPLTERDKLRRNRNVAIAEPDKVHAGIVGRTFFRRAGRQPRIGGRAVHPLRSPDFRVRFRADVVKAVDRDIRSDCLDSFVDSLLVLFRAAVLECGVTHVNRISRLIFVRNLESELLPELLSTVLAVAGTVIVSAVVQNKKTGHVAEDAVERETSENFLQDFKHILLLIIAVRADMDVAVIAYNVSVLSAVSPFRMLFIEFRADL